jgi:hypothetical protein
MSDEEIAALRKRIEQLEAKAKPPEPSRSSEADTAKWIDDMHQMRERRMSMASAFHPDDLRAMEAAAPTHIVKEIALRDARAPTGPSGMVASSQQVSNVREGGGTGWSEPIPLGPPPGIYRVDEQCIADAERQRAELKRKLGG